jgi:hypothetical protein
MRETFKSGSVGGAPGNRCSYLEAGKPLILSVEQLSNLLMLLARQLTLGVLGQSQQKVQFHFQKSLGFGPR